MVATSPPAPGKPARRLSRVAWVAIVLFVCVGVAYLVGRQSGAEPSRVRVLVLAHPVPAYHVIVVGDLASAPVRQAPPDAVSTSADLLGRYTTRPLAQGDIVRIHDVAPPLPAGASLGSIFSVEGGAAISLNGRLAPGDSVDLVGTLADTGPPAVIRGALVLAVDKIAADRWVITVTKPGPIADDTAAALARASVATLRLP